MSRIQFSIEREFNFGIVITKCPYNNILYNII